MAPQSLNQTWLERFVKKAYGYKKKLSWRGRLTVLETPPRFLETNVAGLSLGIWPLTVEKIHQLAVIELQQAEIELRLAEIELHLVETELQLVGK